MAVPGRATLAAGMILAFAATACGKKDTSATDSAAFSGANRATSGGTADGGIVAPGAELSDANIVYMMDNANKLDSTAGSVAATKGTSSDVRDFAKRMMRDHHQLRQQAQDLARSIGVASAAPANDDSQAKTDKAMALLNGAGKGKDFDKAYIDNEVAGHKNVLEMLIRAGALVQNSELKNLIQKAAPAVQAHLDMAESIQAKMK